MSNPRQSLDQFSDQKVSPEMEKELGRRGYQQFLDATLDSFHCPSNLQTIVNWLNEHKVPCSLRNCGAAFQEIEGELETGVPDVTYTKVRPSKEELGIQHVIAGPVMRYNHESLAETQLIREDGGRVGRDLAIGVIEARRAEDEQNRAEAGAIGQPITDSFKNKYQQSLNVRNRPGAQLGQMTHGEARALVAEQFPDMDTRTIEFSRLVAKVLHDNQ